MCFSLESVFVWFQDECDFQKSQYLYRSPGSGLWVMNLMFQEEKILALMSNSMVQTLTTSGITDPQVSSNSTVQTLTSSGSYFPRVSLNSRVQTLTTFDFYFPRVSSNYTVQT